MQFEELLSLDADTIRSLRYVSGQIGRQLLVPMP